MNEDLRNLIDTKLKNYESELSKWEGFREITTKKLQDEELEIVKIKENIHTLKKDREKLYGNTGQ